MGWNIFYQFGKSQNEIDRYLKIIPLITLVDNARVRVYNYNYKGKNDKLEYIEIDQREYTLDDVIMKPDPSHTDTTVLKKTLSCSYSNLPFKEENEKLHMELERSQANLDVGQCEVIQHWIEGSPKKRIQHQYPHVINTNKHVQDESDTVTTITNTKPHATSRLVFFFHNLTIWVLDCKGKMWCCRSISSVSYGNHEWHSDLLGCCSEPKMCMFIMWDMRAFFFPCGTFSKIAFVATNRHMSKMLLTFYLERRVMSLWLILGYYHVAATPVA
uniref:MCAfunc domain-containing protein n=1 Tax=Lactuca sativa TaxID=4236 RepID=A0A9R1W3U4_LACSA|nr:hypothetical protein LSAT_V11C300155150 [Lactuca sativa]